MNFGINNMNLILALFIMTIAGLGSASGQVDHSSLVAGGYSDITEVTADCLSCHGDGGSATNVESHVEAMNHNTWDNKRTGYNNYCVSIVGNGKCLMCHVGIVPSASAYFPDLMGSGDGTPGTTAANIDCLVCHAGDYAGSSVDAYVRGFDFGIMGGPGGSGPPHVTHLGNLANAAASVGLPKFMNCMWCHMKAGAGNKQGDIGGALLEAYKKSDETLDVHLGNGMVCLDCHQGSNHQIPGGDTILPVNEGSVACEDCHSWSEMTDDVITDNHKRLACQTCHITVYADSGNAPIAGKPYPIKEPWIYGFMAEGMSHGTETDVTPTYAWTDGGSAGLGLGGAWKADGSLSAAATDAAGNVILAGPTGGNNDNSVIAPFFRHTGTEPYDTVNDHVLPFKRKLWDGGSPGVGNYFALEDATYGADFADMTAWGPAISQAASAYGTSYSGSIDFTGTAMMLQLNHGIRPKEMTLACSDCHDEAGETVMDFAALGYSTAEIASLEVVWDNDNLVQDSADMEPISAVPALPAIGLAIVGGLLLAIAMRRIKSNK